MRAKIIFFSFTAFVCLASGFVGKCVFDSMKIFTRELRERNQTLIDRGYQKSTDDFMSKIFNSLEREGRVVLTLRTSEGKDETLVLIPKPQSIKSPETAPTKQASKK